MSAKVNSIQPRLLEEARLLEIAWANGPIPLIYYSLGIDPFFDFCQSAHFVYTKPLYRKGPLFRKLAIFGSLKDKEPHTTVEMDEKSIRIYTGGLDQKSISANPPMCKGRQFQTKEEALAMVRQWDRNWSNNYRNFRRYKKDYAGAPGKKFQDFRTFRKFKGKKLTMRSHHLYFQAGTMVPPLLPKTQPVTQAQQLFQIWHVPPVSVAVWPSRTKNHKTLQKQSLAGTKIELKGDALSDLKIKPVSTTASNLDYDGDDLPIFTMALSEIAEKHPLSVLIQTMIDMNLTDKEMQILARNFHIDPAILPLKARRKPPCDGKDAQSSAEIIFDNNCPVGSSVATASATAASAATAASGTEKVGQEKPFKETNEKILENELVDASSSLCRIA